MIAQALHEHSRRQFLQRAAGGLGALALGQLAHGMAPATVAPKAKRVIYLFQSGGPPQLDLLDYKPQLRTHQGDDVPDSVFNGQRLTGMTAGQTSFPVAASTFDFHQHGESGLWLSEVMPHLGKVADDICVVKSLETEAINHDPAITFFQTGAQSGFKMCVAIQMWLAIHTPKTTA